MVQLSQLLWSFVSCSRSRCSCSPPSPVAVLIKAFSVRVHTDNWWRWRDSVLRSGGGCSLSLAPRLSSVGGTAGGALHVLNQDRHQWTPPKGSGGSGASPSASSLPTIFFVVRPGSDGQPSLSDECSSCPKIPQWAVEFLLLACGWWPGVVSGSCVHWACLEHVVCCPMLQWHSPVCPAIWCLLL